MKFLTGFAEEIFLFCFLLFVCAFSTGTILTVLQLHLGAARVSRLRSCLIVSPNIPLLADLLDI